jgi:hypothetical protein
MPFSELEVEIGDPNYQTVDDYTTWFVNSPEAGTDPFSDDWGPNLLGKGK